MSEEERNRKNLWMKAEDNFWTCYFVIQRKLHVSGDSDLHMSKMGL